ncbi:MAG TPA: FAD-binding oxidoreductase, partial [Burkholderiaceae bacterium]|nr:FAD-binding oxidoreductase [Burkholderiaceae bacterium]
MPSTFTKKRSRDRILLSQWDQRSDAHFQQFHISLEHVKAAQLKLQGHIVFPGDPEYDKDRMLFNPAFEAYPSMIIYCAVEADVAVALQLAQQSSLPFTVRSGGHCTAGFSAGSGALIDVSALNDVYIDPVNLFASASCGCPFGKFASAMQSYGLHVPIGECEDVCVGGFVQGGGYGFTSVTFGMNCDNVIDMRVMLADGSIITASPTVNYDLWWAMRGGTGGTFGILLSVRYRLRSLGDVFGWAI